MRPPSAATPLALLLAASTLVGCTSSESERPDALAGCEALLDGRGFEGHLLAQQEPAEGPPGRFYCVFVEERYRNAAPAVQVPARQVLYKSGEDSYGEAPTTIVVTTDFAGAPAAR